LFGHAHDEIEMLILKFFPGLASGPRGVDPEFVLQDFQRDGKCMVDDRLSSLLGVVPTTTSTTSAERSRGYSLAQPGDGRSHDAWFPSDVGDLLPPRRNRVKNPLVVGPLMVKCPDHAVSLVASLKREKLPGI